MVGYSRMMRADEEGTIARLQRVREEVLDPQLDAHAGHVLTTTGDGLIAEFPSVVQAVQCAVAVQRAMHARNADFPADRRLEFRMGISLGDILMEEAGEYHGNGINVAVRLEGLAEPGGICVSETVFQSVGDRAQVSFRDRGRVALKNIRPPIQVYAVDQFVIAEARSAYDTGPERPSLAVLPLENMSGDPDQEYFSDGLTEDIITGLSRVRWLLVIARNSCFTFKGQTTSVRKVGQALGARYVLEGSVRRSGEQVRITAQLVDADTGGHLWADRYDRRLDDIFRVQDDITANIVAAIGPEVTLAEVERARSRRPRSLDAWDSYLRALPDLHQIRRDANRRAKRLLRESLKADPQFAIAHSLLAWCHCLDAFFGWGRSTRRAFAQAALHARRAVDIDGDDPLGLNATALVQTMSGNPVAGAATAGRALELDPNFAMAHGIHGLALAILGRFDPAVEAFQRALRTSPRDPFRWGWYAGIAHACFAVGKYEEAIEWEKKAISLRPTWFGAYVILAASAAQLGRKEEAARATAELLGRVPRYNLRGAGRNPWFADPAAARALLEGLRLAGVPEEAEARDPPSRHDAPSD